MVKSDSVYNMMLSMVTVWLLFPAIVRPPLPLLDTALLSSYLPIAFTFQTIQLLLDLILVYISVIYD